MRLKTLLVLWTFDTIGGYQRATFFSQCIAAIWKITIVVDVFYVFAGCVGIKIGLIFEEFNRLLDLIADVPCFSRYCHSHLMAF